MHVPSTSTGAIERALDRPPSAAPCTERSIDGRVRAQVNTRGGKRGSKSLATLYFVRDPCNVMSRKRRGDFAERKPLLVSGGFERWDRSSQPLAYMPPPNQQYCQVLRVTQYLTTHLLSTRQSPRYTIAVLSCLVLDQIGLSAQICWYIVDLSQSCIHTQGW